MEVTARDFGALRLHEALQLSHPDLNAMNTRQDPDRVKPSPMVGVQTEGNRVYAMLPPASWTMIRLEFSPGKA
jgi:alpha-L-arabinofuranosidase